MNDSNPNDVTQDLSHAIAETAKHPERIGRYRIDKILGKRDSARTTWLAINLMCY